MTQHASARHPLLLGVLVALLMVLVCPGARAQDAMTTVKSLYASAAYEEALTAIDKVRASGPSDTDARSLAEYRAFCLLALGRDAEATRALEDLVNADPFFVPDPANVSPRVRTMFVGIRKRLLPGIAQQRYGTAKAAYDKKEYSAAAEQFAGVLKLIDDPDLGTDAASLTDLRTLTSGFLDLARTAATPPPAPAAAKEPPPPPPPVKPVFDASDVDVVAPVTLRQDLPPFPLTPMRVNAPVPSGALEVVIDENGRVNHAKLHTSISPLYDPLLLSATANWRYKPATRDGKPVKYRKLIQVNVERK